MLTCGKVLSAGSLSRLGIQTALIPAVEQFISLQSAHFAKAAAAPARASKASKKAKDPGSGDSKVNNFLLALTPTEITDLELSSEERAEAERRSKEYSRKKMQQHRSWQKDLTTKIKLRDAAIAALPEELRAAALVPDMESFPANRQMWTLTPPIPGFQEQQTSAMASKFTKGSRRR